jgi:hypothetical protein
MERKIMATMIALVVVAVVVVAVVLATAGVTRKPGGFTKLFDQLEYEGTATYDQVLSLPDDWDVGDRKVVSDQIVDMRYYTVTVQYTTLYITTLYFTYIGDNWQDPDQGTRFSVPTTDDREHSGYILVNHGLFSITVSTPVNLSASYEIGDVIELETTLNLNEYAALAFSEWYFVSD